MFTLHYQCHAGISGDMNLAVLIDLGADVFALQEQLHKLNLPEDWHIDCQPTIQDGLSGTQVKVHYHEHHHHEHAHGRTMHDIEHLILDSPLSERVKEQSLAVFRLLAQAEGQVHGKPADEVHFHEVGATDSIIDIVGSIICLELLQIDRITSTPVELGSGTVKCEHGIMPVPAPATAIIAKQIPITLGGTNHEATTPTGIALIAALAAEFSPQLVGHVVATGRGIGHKSGLTLPNVLHALIFDDQVADNGPQLETLIEFATNLDDMTPEHISFLMTKLFQSGAVDAWQESISMKKGRLACKVCALAHPCKQQAVIDCYLNHSTTLGVRYHTVQRAILPRQRTTISTQWGDIPAKQATTPRGHTRLKPEFDAIAQIATDNNLPLDAISTAGA